MSAARFFGAFAYLAIAVSPTAAQLATTVDSPVEFPREVVVEDATVILHEPQIDTWPEFSSVTGRIAVEIVESGSSEPTVGVAEFGASTDVNVEMRMVAVDDVAITATNFPGAPADAGERLDEIVRAAIRERTHYVPLDVVLSYVAADATVPNAEGLSFDPPTIFYSSSPAFLLMTDGEPILAPLPDSRLKYVVNTNWDLFEYREREWYLRIDERWLKAKALEGPWRYDGSLPGDFKKLPDDGNWDAVKSALPPAKGDKNVPTIFFSDQPAELIVTDGKPTYSTVGGEGLEYIYDTESDVFRHEGKLYYLVSGRWFSAMNLRGPWSHVPELPAVFASIPPDHAKAHVLAAVPGTEEARLAVLEAVIPRRATIARDAKFEFEVHYQGEPSFEPIPGTTVSRAVNSPFDVILHEGMYYLCKEAVWFYSSSANGPWTIADTIPSAIYSIPASSPSYHVTHVEVEESSNVSVSFSYTSGYYGVHVGYGVAMYGSGWYYPPYYGYGAYYGYPYYPYYYPYPYSYGASAWYNPRTGMYGRSASVYGPYGGYGRGASYNPQTGTYARGAAMWDSNEIIGSGYAYNPRTGTGIATNRYATDGGGWGESLVTHNDQWLKTRSEWNDYTSTRRTEFETSGGASGELQRRDMGETVFRTGEFESGDRSFSTGSMRGEVGTAVGLETGDGSRVGVGRSDSGDLYAGRDGQVYRRGDDGWYQHDNDGWNKVEVSEDRQAQAEQARRDLERRRQEAGNRWSTTDFDNNRQRRSFDSARRNELNRSYNARNNGYQRYNQRSRSAASGAQRPRGGQIRRRR